MHPSVCSQHVALGENGSEKHHGSSSVLLPVRDAGFAPRAAVTRSTTTEPRGPNLEYICSIISIVSGRLTITYSQWLCQSVTWWTVIDTPSGRLSKEFRASNSRSYQPILLTSRFKSKSILKRPSQQLPQIASQIMHLIWLWTALRCISYQPNITITLRIQMK